CRTASSIVRSCGFILVLFKAASCSGSSPTYVGETPLASTKHGTSTTALVGKLLISPPVFNTLPPIFIGLFVSISSFIYVSYLCFLSCFNILSFSLLYRLFYLLFIFCTHVSK